MPRRFRPKSSLLANPIERRLASWLISAVTREEPLALRELDPPGSAASSRKNPDIGYTDRNGQEFVIEVTRLMAPRLMEVYNFAIEHISNVVSPQLDGLHFLTFRCDQLDHGIIPPAHARAIVTAITDRLDHGALPWPFKALDAYEITRGDDGTGWLQPFLLADPLPYNAKASDTQSQQLQRQFEAIVAETHEKMEGYRGHRILLVDIAQTGLDAEYHSLWLGGQKPLLAHWADDIASRWQNVEEIYLQPGVALWSADGLRIASPTAYTGEARGFHIRLRPGPVAWTP